MGNLARIPTVPARENFDDMQARYVQVKASGDDMDDPKLYVDSKPGRPPK